MGNDERFRALFAELLPAVLAYALRRVTQPADAADVVAETFLVAWRRIDDVPPGDAARPWMFGVARLVLANHARGQRRRDGLGQRLMLELQNVAVADHATASAESLAVTRAMEQLDETDGEMLRLSSWEGLTPAEIGVALAIPATTARSRLHRARNRLRAVLISEGWFERTAEAGHVEPDERVLAKDAGCER
jgi:RNA polymerase sigma factor (sigma-70 family)